MTGVAIPFQKRRTYLDACREQGVFQQREELKAENVALVSELANMRQGRSAEVVPLDRAEKVRRGEFLDAFLLSGLGPEYLPLLRHLVVETNIPGHRAAGLFNAASADDAGRQK